ncbi:MAG: TonB-dependent receptor [Hyphomonadaceae bacterium]|nr:TonB-dependent receptor [Hyphomonadaceae bacterium]
MSKKSDQGRKTLLRSASVLAAAAAAVTATPALAQNDDEAIVVTGSRIARTDANSALPLTVVDAEQIANAGIIGLGEILRQDPAIGAGGGFNQSNILSGGGAQTIDLRNLGPNRTLVLVDGQRYSLFTDSLQNEGQDLGLLPASMIQRVEILRDGASTAYGADAVAGVVNFILRDNYEGFETTGMYGISDRGDGEQMRVGFIAGASNDRGNVLIAMEYQNRDAIPQIGGGRGLMETPFGGFITATPFATIGSGIGGPQLRTPTNGLVEAFGVNGGFCPAACNGGATARYNYALDQDIVSSLEGYNIAFNATYEVTDNIEWHGTAMYGSRFSEFGLAANPMSANSPTGPYLSGILIQPGLAGGGTNTSNPYTNTTPLSLTWRPVPYGAREQSFNASQIWVSTGLSGTIAENYSWEITGTHSEVNSNGQTAVVPNAVRLSRLLNAPACAADPVCSSPAVGAVANIRNLFSGATPLTPGQQNYAFYVQSTNSRFITDTVQASISGPILTLPGGDMAFAAGVEYREEYGKATPDSVTLGGESIANATFPTEGTFDVLEFFAELDIPLLRGAPLAEELSLNLQGRHSDFSNFGTTETWKAGIVWAPFSDLRIRANTGTSFRAPNVTELFAVGIQSFNTLQDPCSTGPAGGTSTGVRNDPLAVANCAAVGVPLSYVQPAAQLRVLSGGNPNLQPEEGQTFTVGFVYQPSFFTPLTVTVDYWNLELDSAIVGGALSTRLLNCYRTQPASAFAPGGTCFELGQRTAGGVPTNLVSILQNSTATSQTSGIDFTASLAFDNVGPGDLRLAVRGSHLLEADGGLFFGAGFDATGYFDSLTSGVAFPEYRATFDADYDVGSWRFSWQTRFISQMDDANCPSTACPVGNAYNYTGVDDYYIHDARVRFAGDNYSLTFGVNNLLDEDAPLALNTGNNTMAAVYDVVGRAYFVGVSARF